MNFWREYKIWEMTKNTHKNSKTKFEFDSIKISCDRSIISKMVIRYRVHSLSVNASSIFSVKLVIIWVNLEERVSKNWPAILLSCDNFIFFFHVTLIWAGSLRVRFEVKGLGGRGIKLLPSLKHVGIMLETSNLVRKYIHICNFRKYPF